MPADSTLTPPQPLRRSASTAAFLAKRWRVLISVPMVTSIVVGAMSFTAPTLYRSRAEIVADDSKPSLGLASMLGLQALSSQLGGIMPQAVSPMFYAAVIQSKGLLDSVLALREPTPTDLSGLGDSATVQDILEGQNRRWFSSDTRNWPVLRRLEHSRSILEKSIVIETDNATSIVTISVETRDPSLSAQLVSAIVHELNRFNQTQRRSRASEQRRFLDDRVSEARSELAKAESAHSDWLTQNMAYQSAPRLVAENDRQEREISRLQDQYLTLGRQLETARLSEVNNTPTITVVDPPSVPWRKSSPHRAVWAALGFVCSLLVTVMCLLILAATEQVPDGALPPLDQLRTRFPRIFASPETLQ